MKDEVLREVGLQFLLYGNWDFDQNIEFGNIQLTTTKVPYPEGNSMYCEITMNNIPRDEWFTVVTKELGVGLGLLSLYTGFPIRHEIVSDGSVIDKDGNPIDLSLPTKTIDMSSVESWQVSLLPLRDTYVVDALESTNELNNLLYQYNKKNVKTKDAIYRALSWLMKARISADELDQFFSTWVALVAFCGRLSRGRSHKEIATIKEVMRRIMSATKAKEFLNTYDKAIGKLKSSTTRSGWQEGRQLEKALLKSKKRRRPLQNDKETLEKMINVLYKIRSKIFHGSYSANFHEHKDELTTSTFLTSRLINHMIKIHLYK